jgi:capsular polysaccharide biosynthesis protein
MLREKILKNIAVSNASNKRVYISRKNARNGRRVVNASQLEDLLENYGFEAYEFDNMPLKEQISIMANANWLVGPHGAGFVHTLFMPRNSNVIEVFSPNYINPCMVDAVELLEHNYHMIVSRNDGDYRYRNDMVAPIELIRVTIENIISNWSVIDNG